MDLRNEFCACERFLVETEGDAYTFDLIVLADRRMLCINRGFGYREFPLPDALRFEEMDANTICASCDGVSVVASRSGDGPRFSALGEYVHTYLMRQSQIGMLTGFFDPAVLAAAKSPGLYVRPLEEEGDYELIFADGNTPVTSVIVYDDDLELAGFSFLN